MNSFFEFFSLTDANVRYVVIGSVLLATGSAAVGCFTFLRKRALVGDAIAHAILPGICLAYLLFDSKDPLVLLPGAFFTGWLAVYAIDYLIKATKIKEDTALALVLSVFFGIGILLLTAIQHSGSASQSGLDKFLFGKAASLVGNDLWVFGTVAVLLVVAIGLFFKEFTLLSFDKGYSVTLGLPVKFLEFLLTSLTVLAVVVGIQAVGVVLMAAMLITPAAAARYWTDKLLVMILLAIGFSVFSSVFGAYVSYVSPGMPTGPWIVMIVSIIAMGSFAIAPRKGILSKVFLQRSNRNLIQEENLLKILYQLGEREKDFFVARTEKEILTKREIPIKQLRNGLYRLKKHRYIKNHHGNWIFTKEGQEKGKRIVKLHRLWEMYLTRYLSIAPDHVHDDSDTIEHIITPEIEAKLEEELNYPKEDPHKSEIPY